MVATIAEKRIGNYAIEHFIGYGASSAVFSGYDLKCKTHGVAKNVAIKFIWDREMALDEVRRLERTQSVFEICDLITYDEISGSEIKELIGDTILQLEKAMNCPLPIEDDQPVGMLILKLINGEHLIDRAIYQQETLNPEYEWTVSFQHPAIGEEIVLKEWLTPAARELNLEQRLEILLQLAKAVDESHRQGVVHGDLNPWNVFYKEETGRISIIDLGRNNFGVQGWRTPEHCQLMIEEIEALPPETDIWLLGQWMRYLLPKKGPWTSFIEKCQQLDTAKRPSVREMVKVIKGYLQPKPKRRLLAVAISFSFALFAGIYAWQQRTPFTLNTEGHNRLAVLPFQGSATGRLVAEMVNKSLEVSQDLETVQFVKSREIAKNLPAGRVDAHQLRQAGQALGAQFVLSGSIEETDLGFLKWNGMLLQNDGLRRKLSATGQNPLMLSEAIASVCLKLMGSSEVPLPLSDFYSTDLNANFLYSYGNEFYYEGNYNAAFSMFQKALEFDESFHWAQAKYAFCLFKRGNVTDSEEYLLKLLTVPEVRQNKHLLTSCYAYLAYLYRAKSDLDRAYQYLQEAKLNNESHHGSEDLAYIYSLEALINADLGLDGHAEEAARAAESFYQEIDDQIGQIKNLLIQISVDENRNEYGNARVKLEKAQKLTKLFGLESYHALLLNTEARLSLYEPVANIGPETLDKLQRSREIHTKFGDEYNKLDTDYHIAWYYQRINEVEKAKAVGNLIYQKALGLGIYLVQMKAGILLSDLAIQGGDLERAELLLHELLEDENKASAQVQSMVYSRLGRISLNRGMLEECQHYLEQFLLLAEQAQNQRNLSYAYNNLGELYEVQGEFETALSYYQKSLELKRALKDIRGISWTLRNMVILFTKIDRLDEAGLLMEELMEIDPMDFRSRVVLARLLFEKGNFTQAYHTLRACKEETLATGRWHASLEGSLQSYAKAAQGNRQVRLPVQFGNKF